VRRVVAHPEFAPDHLGDARHAPEVGAKAPLERAAPQERGDSLSLTNRQLGGPTWRWFGAQDSRAVRCDRVAPPYDRAVRAAYRPSYPCDRLAFAKQGNSPSTPRLEGRLGAVWSHGRYISLI
jgi:hypothetical protein